MGHSTPKDCFRWLKNQIVGLKKELLESRSILKGFERPPVPQMNRARDLEEEKEGEKP